MAAFSKEQMDEMYPISQREREWGEVEELVMIYKKQFQEDIIITPSIVANSEKAATELCKRFHSLFNKYLQLLTTGQIPYHDKDVKAFVSAFTGSPELHQALKRRYQNQKSKEAINRSFNFIVESYGSLPREEILMDLQMLFLVVAKRYQQVGRSFCGYLYNVYRFEVVRHVTKFIKNPISIPYKIVSYNEDVNCLPEDTYEDIYYENENGTPDMGWIAGDSCSDIFSELDSMDRRILIKYYLEDWNDRQIADAFCVHINTINQRRRTSVKKIAELLNIDLNDIKRNRRSGLNAVLPMI